MKTIMLDSNVELSLPKIRLYRSVCKIHSLIKFSRITRLKFHNDIISIVEWFVNGKPLPSGSRFKSTYDFGYVSLDINQTYPEDSGIYTCKAFNNKGQATTSGSLRCSGL